MNRRKIIVYAAVTVLGVCLACAIIVWFSPDDIPQPIVRAEPTTALEPTDPPPTNTPAPTATPNPTATPAPTEVPPLLDISAINLRGELESQGYDCQLDRDGAYYVVDCTIPETVVSIWGRDVNTVDFIEVNTDPAAVDILGDVPRLQSQAAAQWVADTYNQEIAETEMDGIVYRLINNGVRISLQMGDILPE